jgi:SWIM zinc finger
VIDEVTVTYRSASTVADDAVYLATERPALFFDGFATHPLPTARALACVAEVAATRFYEPASMIAARIRAADPVVTAEPNRLRFESFSRCAGVHARFDLTEDGLDVRASAPGTTNVDFNPPARAALAKITRRDPLRLTVGADAVGVHTLEGTVVERRVPLPERWVKGFGEVQVAVMRMAPVLELDHVAARRFLDGLPAGKSTVWALGPSLRITRSWQPGAVCLAGTSRLRILRPLARYATSLRAFSDPDASDATAVAWVLGLPGGRITVTLSPDASRGFSGEGGMLLDLVSAPPEIGSSTELPADAATLTWLGLQGRIGYDAADQACFWRHLPYPDEALRADPPRLRDARALVSGVRSHPDGGWLVESGTSGYRVQIDAAGFRCTCPWVARHGTSRGPCKHVLAAAIVARATTSGERSRPAGA